MRAMRFFLGFSAASALVGALAAGCGSSSSPSTPVDSGSGDVTMEATMPQPEAAPQETGPGPDVVEAAMSDVCVPDAKVESLPVPDAAIGDSGATAAGCLSCFESACSAIVTQCDQSCACIAAFESFESCIAAGLQSAVACAFNSFTGVPGIGVTMLACALPCATPCGQMLPVPDSGVDAPAESSSGGDASDASGD